MLKKNIIKKVTTALTLVTAVISLQGCDLQTSKDKAPQNNQNNSQSQTQKTESLPSPTKPTLTGKKWTWQEASYNNKIITPKEKDQFTLSFQSDGKISVTTDCNNAFGSYQVSDNNLTFSQMASTKMYCQNSQEDEFIAMLLKTSQIRIDEQKNLILILQNKEGQILFQ